MIKARRSTFSRHEGKRAGGGGGREGRERRLTIQNPRSSRLMHLSPAQALAASTPSGEATFCLAHAQRREQIGLRAHSIPFLPRLGVCYDDSPLFLLLVSSEELSTHMQRVNTHEKANGKRQKQVSCAWLGDFPGYTAFAQTGFRGAESRFASPDEPRVEKLHRRGCDARLQTSPLG